MTMKHRVNWKLSSMNIQENLCLSLSVSASLLPRSKLIPNKHILQKLVVRENKTAGIKAKLSLILLSLNNVRKVNFAQKL